MEAEKAQNAQIILGNAPGGIADKAHAAMREIVESAGIVEDGAVSSGRQRVDREIAPLGVSLPVAAELNLGMAAIGFDVLAQRSDFEGMLVDDDGDCAVLDAGRHILEPGGRYPFDYLFLPRPPPHLPLPSPAARGGPRRLPGSPCKATRWGPRPHPRPPPPVRNRARRAAAATLPL